MKGRERSCTYELEVGHAGAKRPTWQRLKCWCYHPLPRQERSRGTCISGYACPACLKGVWVNADVREVSSVARERQPTSRGSLYGKVPGPQPKQARQILREQFVFPWPSHGAFLQACQTRAQGLCVAGVRMSGCPVGHTPQVGPTVARGVGLLPVS